MTALLDPAIAAINEAAAELFRIRRLPADQQTQAMRDTAKKAVIAEMLRARTARYQGRTPDGELFHVSITLPPPELRLRLGSTPKGKSSPNPAAETEPVEP